MKSTIEASDAFRVRVRFIVAALATCWLLSSGGTCAALVKDNRDSGYVVLTNLDASDSYFAAARRLADGKSARLIHFPGQDLTPVVDAVRQAQPRFVAFVMRPESVDINFAYQALEWCRTLDEDPFPDFAYGFITGTTAARTLSFVERILSAAEQPAPAAPSLFAFGPTSTPQADQGNPFDWLPGWDSKRIEHPPKGFPTAELPHLAAADVIRFWGHGAPDSVEGGIERKDLVNLPLRARAVFAGPCLTGVTHRYFDIAKKSGQMRESRVHPDDSLALAFLENGAMAYFGALHDDRCISAGQEMEHALTSGEPLGMTLKHMQDRIAMARINHNVTPGLLRDGAKPPTEKGLEAEVRWAAARVLFGDPSMNLFHHAPHPAVDGIFIDSDAGPAIQITVRDPRMRSSMVNPFHDNLGKCGDGDNDMLYARIAIPEKYGKILDVGKAATPKRLARANQGEPADTPTWTFPSNKRLARANQGEPRWGVEQWMGERFLHLQVDFRHESLVGIKPGTTLRFDLAVGP